MLSSATMAVGEAFTRLREACDAHRRPARGMPPKPSVCKFQVSSSGSAAPCCFVLPAGYMGHVTFIANKLVDAAERSLFVSQQLDASKAWADFAAGSLQVLPNVDIKSKFRQLASNTCSMSKQLKASNSWADFVASFFQTNQSSLLKCKASSSSASACRHGMIDIYMLAGVQHPGDREQMGVRSVGALQPVVSCHKTLWQSVMGLVLLLQARNTLENVSKWACGRPAPSELHSGVSDAPDEAGLMDLDPGAARHCQSDF